MVPGSLFIAAVLPAQSLAALPLASLFVWSCCRQPVCCLRGTKLKPRLALHIVESHPATSKDGFAQRDDASPCLGTWSFLCPPEKTLKDHFSRTVFVCM